MLQFPYVTDYINHLFNEEKSRLDYKLLRPVVNVLYFFIRTIAFPLKFVFHRREWGYERRAIDATIAFGLKYLATREAVELLLRHVQIEPILYRYIISGTPERREGTGELLKGIDGDFHVDTIRDIVQHGLTICHDDLAYEVMERFDKQAFLDNIEFYRNSAPEDIDQYSRKVMEVNEKHSLQILGATNVVIAIVIAITIFGDLHTTVRALNSFDSDSLLLWCMKHVCVDDPHAMIDLGFYLQTAPNRSHYNSSVFLSDPNQYLYYHIAFDEFAYELLRRRSESVLVEKEDA